MSTTAIILAAGRNTRLKSKRPKALHEICGRPMLEYILRACYEAGCTRILVVVGYGKDEIVARFGDDPRIHWVEQTDQLGTGHAAKVCEPELKKLRGKGGHGGPPLQSDVFILAGDVPLIRAEVLHTLLKTHREERAAASMATALLDDPSGYGRIVRDAEGNFLDIVEQVDATPQQRDIREVFPSFYCVRVEDLLFALSRLKNDNKKGEYYLTDIYGILRRAGKKVVAVQAATAEDVLAPNTRQQMAEADCVMQDRIHSRLRDGGATIVNSDTAYIEDGASIGMDTVIYPFSFIGRDASIGADCTIGPFACVPRDSIVPEGATIAGNIGMETAMLNQAGS